MSDNQRQHFVPKLLQRFFSKDSKSIGVYSINQGRRFQSSIRTMAQRNWYYMYNEQEKTEMEHWLCEVEESIAPVLKCINGNDSYIPSTEELDACIGFVIIQMMRTPKAASAMQHVFDFCKRMAIPMVMEEVASGLRNDANIPFQSLLGVSSILQDWPCNGMLILRNNTEEQLIMSDNPACIFSPIAVFAELNGMSDLVLKRPAFSACMVYMPISPICAFLLFDERYYTFSCGTNFNLEATDVHTLNTLEIRNASDILLFKKFDENSYVDEFVFRKTDTFTSQEHTIYTPISDSFSISSLNDDRELWRYQICKLAVEHPEDTEPKLDGLI